MKGSLGGSANPEPNLAQATVTWVPRGAGAAMTVEDIICKIREFCDEREWAQFHNPKDLAEAICREAGELLEHFLWKRPEESDDVAAHRGEAVSHDDALSVPANGALIIIGGIHKTLCPEKAAWCHRAKQVRYCHRSPPLIVSGAFADALADFLGLRYTVTTGCSTVEGKFLSEKNSAELQGSERFVFS